MSEINAFWLITGNVMGAFVVAGIILARKKLFPAKPWPKFHDEPESKDIPYLKRELELQAKESVFRSELPISISGGPIRIPWHIRRKELEEAARTKRRKLESFQEYV